MKHGKRKEEKKANTERKEEAETLINKERNVGKENT